MKQRVPEKGSRCLLGADSGRALPPWSDVTRWTDPSTNWGCAPARNRPGAYPRKRSHQTARAAVSIHSDILVHASLPIPERTREPITLPDQPRDNKRHRNTQIRETPTALPAFVPLNVHLGEPVSAKTGQPRAGGDGHDIPTTPVSLPDRPVETQTRRKKNRRLKRLFAATCAIAFVLLIVGTGWFGWRVLSLNESLPALPTRPAATLPEASMILASDGSELGTLFDERRTWVPLESINPVVIDALLAAEDHRFPTHKGVDWIRMAGAFWSTLTEDPEGASTIPMQLARNYFPELKQHTLLDRKIEEVLLARHISNSMTKDETLSWYLNTVAFGHNSFGIEAAAERFYSTTSADLSLSQAALLVGLLKGPSRYDPLRNPDNARSRRNIVLRRMAELEMISPAAANAATALPLKLRPKVFDPADSFAPYFLDYVRREAEQWATRAGYDLRNDGLIIHTSIDPHLQRLAKEAVAKQTNVLQNVLLREFGAPGSVRNERFWREKRAVENDLIRRTDPYRTLRDAGRTDIEALYAVRQDPGLVRSLREEATRLQGALVVMDPGSGQILAWVGGHDYRQDQFDKVASARRQPGSIFKPILYARAIEDGYSPYYLVQDEIRTFVTNTRGERWTPTNAGGGASGRLLTLEQGLVWSKNTVSAHLISRIGPQDVIDLAHDMGVESSMMPVPSLALGTSETSLLEMANTYATLADHGVRHNVTAITTITNKDGDLVATFPSEPDRVLSEQTSYTMIRMLQKVVDQGTGSWLRSRFELRGDLAGKTGTTQNSADGWFIGMHPDAVVGVWVGFNDQRITFQSDYWDQGGHNALLLAGEFLQQSMRGPGAALKPTHFKRPQGYREPSRPLYSSPSPDVEPESSDTVINPPEQELKLRAPVPLPLEAPASSIRTSLPNRSLDS